MKTHWMFVGAALLGLAQAPAEDAKREDATPTRLVFRASDGLEMSGLYWAPAARKAPGLLLLHHLGHNAWAWDEFARRLRAEGYAVLAVNLRGHPEAATRKAGGMNWLRFELPDFQGMAKDVDAARACLGAQREVDPTHLGLVGEQFGANLALAGGTAEPFRTAVLLSPALNERGLKGPEALAAFGDRPCLAAASTDDPQGSEVLEALKASAKGRFEMLLLPSDASPRDYGALMLTDPAKKDLGDRIVAFLKETLAPGESRP